MLINITDYSEAGHPALSQMCPS